MVKKAMVMAAGVGSRLDPLTKDTPKPLVPVANKPVMDILFERLKEIGIKDVIANTHYLSDKIIEHYEADSLGMNFNYVKEEELSGTAGGVKKCQFFFDEGDDFLILSADGLSNADLEQGIRFHKASGAIVTIGIKPVPKEEIPHFGVVVTDEHGFITEFQEKPAIEDAKSDCINTGIYIFNYKIFDYIPADTFYDFAKNVFPTLMKEGIKINTFPVEQYWSDIGTLDQYIESTKDVFDGKCTFNHSEIIETETGKYITEKSHIASSATFEGFNTIGKDCIIGKNVKLKNCIIWNNVEIKDGVTLEDCIIASNSEIKADLNNQIIGANQIISQGVFSE